jgi:hypothetical protein
LKLGFIIRYEAEYPDTKENAGNIILDELENFDYKYLIEILAAGQFKLEINEIKNEETF